MKKLLLTLLLFATAFSCIAQKAKNVTVSTPDEFIKAIASNTNITLKTNGTLAITSALDKLDKSRDVTNLDTEDYNKLAPGVYFSEEADGRSILIANINNLSIVGANSNREDNHIQAEPSYANVLMFINCNNITVKNIKAGHVERGYCVGDVLSFSNCKNSNVENCDLYGCGVNGISMYETNGLKVSRTEIHDCSENMVVISDCQNISFINCYMHDCGSGIATWGDNNSNITYEECEIIEREYEDEYYGDEGYYDEEGSSMPDMLLISVQDNATKFRQDLGTEYINGVVYEVFDEEAAQILFVEAGVIVAYIVRYEPSEDTYVFDFVDKADPEKGERMGFADGHILTMKEDGVMSYEIKNDKVESVTFLKLISEDKAIYRHGKTKNTLKDCSKDVAKPHFDFQIIDVEEYRQEHEEYPWG